MAATADPLGITLGEQAVPIAGKTLPGQGITIAYGTEPRAWTGVWPADPAPT